MRPLDHDVRIGHSIQKKQRIAVTTGSNFRPYLLGDTAMHSEEPTPERLLTAAKAGDRVRVGELLELYRNYLKLLARTQIDLVLQSRANPSDVVQDTFLEAYRDFPQFRGDNEAQFLAWLRRILLNNLSRLVERHLLTKKRDARREFSLDQLGASLEWSNMRLESALAAPNSSPSWGAQRRERAALLADQLARLPEAYREVLVLRHLENLSFEEVAQRMDRSNGAVRMLWLRAIDQLRKYLNEDGLL